ncbi:MAG: DNA repair protein RecO [Oscillospiraceae bacterium]|nr:DNA repair protein RecO [Oscillospiraceae bacterium]
MRLSTDGLIIKENNVGESDRAVVILTRDKGIIRAFVPGARRLRNKNSSSTGMLCYSNIVLFKSRDTYKIDEASAIEVFFSLRSDIVILTVAQYICELCLNLAPEEDRAEDYLRLALNSLHFLSKNKLPIELVKAITELRMMALSGYMPNLVACNKCSLYESDRMFFDPLHGLLYCDNCKPTNAMLFRVNPTVLTAMRHIVYSEFNKLYSFTIPDNDLKQLSEIVEKYLVMQTEHKFKTLDFLHSLNI